MSQSTLAANLLAAARNLLLNEIAPALPGSLRFPAAPLDDLQRSFARDLRAGRFDREEHAGLRALLRSSIQLRLKISAPHLAEKAGTTP
jgi:hypothetical protein